MADQCSESSFNVVGLVKRRQQPAYSACHRQPPLHYHFGRGLVSSPNDLGRNGRLPSHPELLDYLAAELMAANWQFKPLHRQILLSRVYQQSCESKSQEAGTSVDPENELLWHFPKRRLTAEEIRDSMLMMAGQIDFTVGGPSIMLPVDKALIDELYKPSQWQVASNPAEHARRSVYLIAKRNLRLPFMEVFDQPTLQASCARRESSTHAPQALELLNGQISNTLAASLAERLIRETGNDRDAMIQAAFRLVTGRLPSSKEQRIAKDFLTRSSLNEFALAMFNLNSFLYVR